MSVKLAAVTIDCDDRVVVARFWSAALERPVDAGASSEFASIGMPEHRDTVGWAITDGDHPTWLFAKVPECNSPRVTAAAVGLGRIARGR